MPIIAQRNPAQSKVVFFKQIGETVLYSFDRTQWFVGFTLPAYRPRVIGNQPYDPKRGAPYYIKMYRTEYYLNRTVNQTVNFTVNFTRNEIEQNAPELTEAPLKPQKICATIRFFLEQMRETGQAYANGTLEGDDLERGWEYGSAVAGAGLGVWFGGPFGAMGGAILGAIAGAMFAEEGTQVWLPLLAQYSAQWSDEDIDTYTCCLYEELKDGDFNYTDMVNAGNACGIGAWDEILNKETWAGILALLKHGDDTTICDCEVCEIYKPTEGDVISGKVLETALMTTDQVVSGSLRRMTARVKFEIPNQVITSISFWALIKPYENLSDSNVPRIQLITPGSGGGFTDLTNSLQEQFINPAHLPLVPVTEFELIIQTSTCSACSTAQNNLYLDSYGVLLQVKVCGTLQ